MLLDDRLETHLYVISTDKHPYLFKSSCHPSHTKQSIPFSMALRLRRICPTDEFLNTRAGAPSKDLMKKGFKPRFVKDAIEKVRKIPRSGALETSIEKESHRIPFVITFNPDLPNIREMHTFIISVTHVCILARFVQRTKKRERLLVVYNQ